MGKRADEHKPKKANIFKWRGALDGASPTVRRVIALVLLMLGIMLTFTQLSFVSFETPSGDVVYLMLLLVLTGAGSMLLGTATGTLLGFLSGVTLLIHSQVQPLDYYELLFVSPLTSFVMLGFAGLLFGMLFALALRGNPPQLRRAIYIAIASLVVAALCSVSFSVHAFVALVARLSNSTLAELGEARLDAMVQSTFMSLGDVGLAIALEALLTAVICISSDYLSRRVMERDNTLSIRSIFASWLAVVVMLLYMGAVAVSVVAISDDELKTAEIGIIAETNYLCKQLSARAYYGGKFERFVSESNLTAEQEDTSAFYNLQEYFYNAFILNGYTMAEDGTIILVSDDLVMESDDPRFPTYINYYEEVCRDMVEGTKRSLESGRLERFVFDGTEQRLLLASYNPEQELANYEVELPEISFVYAQQIELASYYHGKVTYTVVIMQPSSMVFARRSSVLLAMSLSSLVMMAGAFAMVFFLLTRVVAKSIDEENEALALICAGELDTRATAGGTQEFESLSEGINTTVDALKGWIKEAETRMDAELATAKAIQEAALPGTFPPYPDILRFDIYAMMQAARQVGGDFYDFFLVGDDCDASSGKLAFVVADVSGKGVPGALLMMKAKAQIRNYVGSEMELGEAMSEVNRQLIEGNDEGMFVTAWVGLLDYGTGHIEYVNAGHNPPLLWQRDGGWRWMRKRSGPMLGCFEISYRAHAVECDPGDTFVLYTDGVTEAFDVGEKLYGEDRLLEVANKGYRLHPRELLESIRDDVFRHSEGAEQSDDITILTLEVGVPPETTATLVLEPKISELDRVNDFLHSELDRRLCPSSAQTQLDIAVEELFVNICNYAYAASDVPGKILVHRTYSADPTSIRVDFIDTGVPFNPLEKPDAVTPSRIEDVPIGGLGILMVKRCVDEISYERSEGCNIVTIVKKW